jgi:response regulator RpfG family c-di-GMP phosphodiesterase
MEIGPLAGARVLVAGGPPQAAETLGAQLRAAGAAMVGFAGDLGEVGARTAAVRADLVLALGPARDVRDRLDPLGLQAGPPVVALADVAVGEKLGSAGLERLRLEREHRALRARVAGLEAVVAGGTLAALEDAEAIRLDALDRLARAAEYRDDNTPEHMQRVAALAARLARGLGEPDRVVRLLQRAAALHDLGKIAIPDSILLKPGPLGPEELAVVQTHAELGARVLAGSGAEAFQVAEQVARAHHERWDGTGYPDGLAGEAIPLAARIVHVADVFDVLLHERPYKEAWTVGQAVAEIRAGAGSQFDPDVVEAFSALGPAAWEAGPPSS